MICHHAIIIIFQLRGWHKNSIPLRKFFFENILRIFFMAWWHLLDKFYRSMVSFLVCVCLMNCKEKVFSWALSLFLCFHYLSYEKKKRRQQQGMRRGSCKFQMKKEEFKRRKFIAYLMLLSWESERKIRMLLIFLLPFHSLRWAIFLCCSSFPVHFLAAYVHRIWYL